MTPFQVTEDGQPRQALTAWRAQGYNDPPRQNQMAKTRILAVDDDQSTLERYEWILQKEHKSEFITVLASTARQGILVLEKHPHPPVDIVILDWNLPDMEGTQVLKLIKSNGAMRSILVMMVTGRTSPEDAAKGLETGADDYLRKDFGNDELISRLHALLRRREQSVEDGGGYALDGLNLDPRRKQVMINGNPVTLRKKEFVVLKMLMERPDMIHSHTYLGGILTEDASQPSPETVRRHISNLRQALGPWGERIEVFRGEGYRLRGKSPVSQS